MLSPRWLWLAAVGVLVGQPVAPAVIVVESGCSLADAVAAANSDSSVGGCPAGSGMDEIQLTEDVVLFAALPPLTQAVIVDGNGFAVRRDGSAPDFAILELGSSETTKLRNLTLSNGRAERGGGLNDTLLGDVTLSNLTITGNEAFSKGGGIYKAGGDITLVASTISNNQAGTSGGGIYGSWDTSIALTASTLSGNSAGTDGGGLTVGSMYGNLTLVNSTVTDNVAANSGGGVYATGYGATVTVSNSTITGNSAAEAGGLSTFSGGYPIDVDVGNTIIANNTGGNCVNTSNATDLGGNFDDDGSCLDSSPISPGVDFETTAANNGGATATHALLPGSVAVNAAGACGLATDQRGFPRDDGVCDSGAYERVGFSLSITGDCPGAISVEVTTPSPNQSVALFVGPGTGSSTVPLGPCGGTELDIAMGRRWRSVATNETGQALFAGTVPSSWCNRAVQAVDLGCATSNTVLVP